jgi:hypothetical protein
LEEIRDGEIEERCTLPFINAIDRSEVLVTLGAGGEQRGIRQQLGRIVLEQVERRRISAEPSQCLMDVHERNGARRVTISESDLSARRKPNKPGNSLDHGGALRLTPRKERILS